MKYPMNLSFKRLNSKNISAIIPVITILLLTVLLYYNKDTGLEHGLSPQSERMITAARQETFHDFLKKHPKPWPPGYSALLFVSHKAGIPLPMVNLVLFLATLVLIMLLIKKYTANVPLVFPVLFYAAAAFNYYNLAQFTSEHLVIPLSLVTFYFMTKYLDNRNLTNLLLTAGFAAVLFPTRYFVLVWIFPILSYKILCFPGVKFKERFLHFVVFCFTSLYFISLWMFHMYVKYGYLTGGKRMGKSKELTGFAANVYFTLKTLYLDFFSPFTPAGHRAVNNPYRFHYLEYIILSAVLIVLAISIYTVVRWYGKNHKAPRLAKIMAYSFQSGWFMILEFFIVYIAAIIVIWTFGHTDPMYSRFLYPSYVFFILFALVFYDRVVKMIDNKWYQLVFVLFYGMVLVLNVYKTFTF